MGEFSNYGLIWFIYLCFALSFLWLSQRKTKNLSPWLKIPLLSFIAAFALTPGTTMSGESWLSPAAIIMIFQLDQSGLSGLWKPLAAIIMVWLLISIVYGLVHYFVLSKPKPTKSQ